MNYDFSPLSSPVTQADVKYVRQILKPKSNNTLVDILAIMAIIICFSGLFFILYMIISNYPMTLLFFVPLVIGILWGLLAYRKKYWQKNVRLYRFALANSLSFKLENDNPGYDGLIFNIGDNRESSDILRDMNNKFEVANYTYSETHGSGDDKHTTYYHYGYIMIQLTKKLPHMVLDSKSNNMSFFGANLSNLPTSFSKDQVLSLEGDFDKYFTLYAPKEYEQDALYVFSPELMAMFIDESKQFDAEIVDDKLFIYCSKHFDFSDIDLVKKLFDIVNKFGKAVIHNTEKYVDETVGDKSANIISLSGRRLKSGMPLWAIIIFVIFTIFMFLQIFMPFGFGNR